MVLSDANDSLCWTVPVLLTLESLVEQKGNGESIEQRLSKSVVEEALAASNCEGSTKVSHQDLCGNFCLRIYLW